MSADNIASGNRTPFELKEDNLSWNKLQAVIQKISGEDREKFFGAIENLLSSVKIDLLYKDLPPIVGYKLSLKTKPSATIN